MEESRAVQPIGLCERRALNERVPHQWSVAWAQGSGLSAEGSACSVCRPNHRPLLHAVIQLTTKTISAASDSDCACVCVSAHWLTMLGPRPGDEAAPATPPARLFTRSSERERAEHGGGEERPIKRKREREKKNGTAVKK